MFDSGTVTLALLAFAAALVALAIWDGSRLWRLRRKERPR